MRETANPLLEGGYRIPFHRIRAEHVEPGVRALLSRAQEALDALSGRETPPTWENTLGRLEEITQEVGEALVPVSHLLSVSETPELREAYNQVLPDITAFWSRLPLNEALWERVQSYAETPEAEELTGIRSRHLEKTLKEFRRAGADLPPDDKARLERIRLALARLSRRFSENVLDATAAYQLHVQDEDRLEGIPPGPRRRFREAARQQERDGWILTLDFPSYEAVMKYATDRSLREEVHRAYLGRCRGDEHDNLPLIPAILSLRQEMAELLGHRDFPDYRLEDAMVTSGDRAAAFEEDLKGRTRPFWEADLKELREHATGLGLEGLRPWDVSFVAESLRRERFRIDDEVLRPYFPLDQVLDGLFETVHRVFGITVSPREIEEVWHSDVGYYELRDEDGTWLGSFYTDWFPRKEKREGAWMNDFLTGGPEPDGGFRPHLGFMAGNFSPPDGDDPSLLSHREVRTVFHEFGHLLHHLTSRVPVPARAGLNVAWDWVELPSQIMENWTWEEEALQLFARHHETGEVLPSDLLERLLAARQFMGGWHQMRQIAFGTLDLALHADLAPQLPSLPLSPEPEAGEDAREGSPEKAPGASTSEPEARGHAPEVSERESPVDDAPEEEGPAVPEMPGFGGQEILAFARKRMEPFSPDPEFAESHPLSTFSHLFSGGYAAGYYSYLWSEVLDADAFTRFQKEGILNRETGRAYVEAILSRGDSAEPEELFREFMGRDPDPEALMKRNLGPPPGEP